MAQGEAPNARLQRAPFSMHTPSSFRQDFCNITWHNSKNFSNIGSLLQGVELNSIILMGEFIKFATAEDDEKDKDIFNYDNDEMKTLRLNDANYPGLVARIMDEVCRRAGCTWRNTYSIVGAIPANTTWSDLLIWTTDMYDISVEWWMRSTERMRSGATFTEPWYAVLYFLTCRLLALVFFFSFPRVLLLSAHRLPLVISLYFCVAQNMHQTSLGTMHPSLW
jgi:hypothetical protein